MEIKLSIPQSSTEFEMREISENFEIDGDRIRFTDQTGGTDWDVPFIAYALSLLAIPLTVITTEASKEIGKKLGSVMGDDAVKLYENFKKGIKKLISKKDRTITQSPYMIFHIISDKRTYEVVFELGLLNEENLEISFTTMTLAAVEFITKYEKAETIIDEAQIGVVMYWDKKTQSWKPTLVEGIESNGRIYNI